MSEMDIFYTYIYYDPTRGMEPLYVGKGKNKRSTCHWEYVLELERKGRRSRPSTFIQRLQNIRSKGSQPVIKFLAENIDEELAFFVEQEAISLYGRKDKGIGPLLNRTDGGEGASGNIISDAQKAQVSKVHKGKTLSEETKAKLRQKTKEQYNDPEKAKAHALATKAAMHRPDVLAKQAAGRVANAGKPRKKRQPLTPEQRARIAAGTKLAMQRPEVREKYLRGRGFETSA